MKLLSRINNFKQKFSKKVLATGATLAVLLGMSAGMVSADFFPNRVPYDYNKGSDSSNCADPKDPGYDHGRCGSMTGPVFNTFINTPSYGDERAFADARRSDESITSYKNVVADVTSGSKEVVIRTYVHNNANESLNASGVGIAKDTKVRILLPTATSNGLRARSYISASNASLVEDTVDFTAPQNFSMSYIPGSATLINDKAYKNGVKLSDDIVTTGAPIGDDALDGSLPGCFGYTAVVEIRVKITTPVVDFTKQVKLAATDAWGETVAVKPGDNVKWLVKFQNKGVRDLTNVNINDVLPPHLTVVPGSVKYTDAAQTTVQSDTQLFTTGGINFNTWLPNGGFYVTFDTTAKDDFNGCSVVLRNIAKNKSDQTSVKEDTADVTITKNNCNVTTPTYSCDALTLSSTTLKVGDKVKVTARYTAVGGATFKNAVFSFGDTATFATNNSSNNTVVAEHAYAAAGTYGVSVKLDFTVAGQTKTVEGGKCVAQLKVTTTTPPTTIPDTGTGSMIALFASVATAGAFVHNMLARRNARG